MYRADEKVEFKFLHVFTRIEGCEKWKQLRDQLCKAKEYVPDAAAAGASEGRPDGHKKAKAARDGAPAAAKLQASIETCIADVATKAAKRDEKTKTRWTALMANQGTKLDLLKTTTAAKKRNNDRAFLMGGDPAAMDPQVREWFMAHREAILFTPTTPTPPPSTTDASADPSPATAADTSSASGTADTATPPPSTAPIATPSSAPTPTTARIDLDDDAEVSPVTI